jgi:Zn-dependent metalloprotease
LTQAPPGFDSSRRAAARKKTASDPIAVAHRDRALQPEQRKTLLLGANDSLAAVSVVRDDRGGVHVRLVQLTNGLPVRRAGVISHADSGGVYQPYTAAVVPGIATSPTPKLTREAAISIAERNARHRFPFVAPPRTELVYLPVYTRVLKRTGGAVPPPAFDQFADDPIPDSLQPEDIERRLVDVRLAWEVSGLEGDAGRRMFEPRRVTVDALDGRVLEVRDLDDTAIGKGSGVWNKLVSFQTIGCSGGSRMEDPGRKFFTVDYDNSDSNPVNCDSDNVWGDGQPFLPLAGDTNRQTAMVDGHFGATVYWDMMHNVWNRQGPDNDFYSVNVYTHYGVAWDDAKYSSSGGNVFLGDGASRQRLDCLGHELGHGFNDFVTNFPSGHALNESLADVFGEWTDAYLASGNFASRGSLLGAIGDADWINRCSGRNLVRPGSNGNPSMWFADILDIEEHRGSAPASRAFTFLARGASPFLGANNYSPKLPWGMTGIGLQKAARIYFLAHAGYLPWWVDYADLRAEMIFSATLLFGPNSVEEQAVRNAYAGINLGSKASGYPASPTVRNEVEANNNSRLGAQLLGTPSGTIPAGAALPAPEKFKVRGGGASGDVDWFRVGVPSGKDLSARLTSDNLADIYSVQIWNNLTKLAEAIAGPGAGTANSTSAACPGIPVCRYYVRVHAVQASVVKKYTLEIDVSK